MNSYITLDGHKYVTPVGWQSKIDKPSTIRQTLNGVVDVTYGPADFREWNGVIRAYVTAQAGFGTDVELLETLSKKAEVLMIDHYGTSYYVHVISPFEPNSFTSQWDAGSNHFDVMVRVVVSRNA